MVVLRKKASFCAGLFDLSYTAVASRTRFEISWFCPMPCHVFAPLLRKPHVLFGSLLAPLPFAFLRL